MIYLTACAALAAFLPTAQVPAAPTVVGRSSDVVMSKVTRNANMGKLQVISLRLIVSSLPSQC